MAPQHRQKQTNKFRSEPGRPGLGEGQSFLANVTDLRIASGVVWAVLGGDYTLRSCDFIDQNRDAEVD